MKTDRKESIFDRSSLAKLKLITLSLAEIPSENVSDKFPIMFHDKPSDRFYVVKCEKAVVSPFLISGDWIYLEGRLTPAGLVSSMIEAGAKFMVCDQTSYDRVMSSKRSKYLRERDGIVSLKRPEGEIEIFIAGTDTTQAL